MRDTLGEGNLIMIIPTADVYESLVIPCCPKRCALALSSCVGYGYNNWFLGSECTDLNPCVFLLCDHRQVTEPY
jgi:hypothetical protein